MHIFCGVGPDSALFLSSFLDWQATRLRLTQQAAYRLEVPLNTAVDVLQTAEDGMKRVRLLLRDADEKEAWVLPEDLQAGQWKGGLGRVGGGGTSLSASFMFAAPSR